MKTALVSLQSLMLSLFTSEMGNQLGTSVIVGECVSDEAKLST